MSLPIKSVEEISSVYKVRDLVHLLNLRAMAGAEFRVEFGS